MTRNLFIPTVLTVAIGVALVGCGGGGSSSPNSVSRPPVSGGTDPKPPVSGGIDPTPPTSSNKVKVGVMDTGVRINDSLNHAVQKVFSYIDENKTGIATITDLTDADLNAQDLSTIHHGTMVAQVIAGKYPNGSVGKAGLAADIAEIYGVRTSDTVGLGRTSTNLQAMIDLNKKFGIQLFNASFGSQDYSEEYKQMLTGYAEDFAKTGSLVVFAAGNAGYLNPDDEATLPVGHPDIEKGFLAVTGLNSKGDALYRDSKGGANACGKAARWCLATDYIYGKVYNDKYNRYEVFSGTSTSAAVVTSAAAMVWSKYPWMTADQIRQVILTSSDYIDDGSGRDVLFNQTFGWGALNIEDALKGPALFSRIFAENFAANVSSDLAIFSNNIGGDAGLIKSGHGTLVMAGDSTYAGSTTIDAGKLQITGSITSDVKVNKGGTLSGRGGVGAVTNNGIVSTQDGRLTINGDYQQSTDGILAYRLNQSLTVKGKANLNGMLEVSAQNSQMVTEGRHDVLTAEKITGSFSGYKSTSPFLKVKDLATDINKVSVDVHFADAAKAGTVSGGMSTASGELVNKLMAKANAQALLGENTNLTNYISRVQQTANNNAAQALLNTSSGALFAETPSVLLRNDTLINAQIAQRTHQVMQQGQAGVWASGSYLETTNKASGWDTVDSDINVASVGVDQVFGQAMLGAYLSHYNEKSKYSASNGSSKTKLTEFGLYGKWQTQSPFYVAANAKYGSGDIKFDRTVTNGSNSESSNAKSDVDKYGVYAEVGYALQHDQFSLSPYLALSHNKVSMDAIHESSNLGVAVDHVRAKESNAHLGLRVDYNVSKQLIIAGYTEYAYTFDRSLPNVQLSSNVDNSIVVNYQAPSFDKDFFLYGVGFNYITGNSKWNVFGDVAGNAINSGDYQLQLGLKYAF